MKPAASEIAQEAGFLFTRIGIPGSGNTRYSAAMALYNEDLISGELLEIYRRCCKFDHEDPIELAKHESIATVSHEELAEVWGCRK